MAVCATATGEPGTLAECYASGGTVSVQSAIKNSGAYAIRCNPATGGATGYITLGKIRTDAGLGLLSNATVYGDVVFQVQTLPGASSEPLIGFYRSGGTFQCELRVNSAGKLEFYDKNLTLQGTGTFVLATATWYHLQVKVFANATTGTFDAKIAAHGSAPSSDLALTGLNTDSSNVGRVGFGKTLNRNSQVVDYVFDIAELNDSAWLPAGIKKASGKPAGAGNYTAFTGSYLDVDDIPDDGDTTYIYSTTATNKESVALTSTTTEGVTGTVHYVAATVLARDLTATSDIQLFIRSNTTEQASSSRDVGASYETLQVYAEVDPHTSSAWTLGGVDAAEVGVTQGSTPELRVTQALLVIIYTPSAGGSVDSDAVVPVESHLLAYLDSLANIDYTSKLNIDVIVQAESTLGVNADTVVPDENLALLHKLTVAPLENTLFAYKDSPVPIEWTGALIVDSDADIPLEYVGQLIADADTGVDYLVLVHEIDSVPVEYNSILHTTTAVPIEFLRTVDGETIFLVHHETGLDVDTPFRFEASSGVYRDSALIYESLEAIARDESVPLSIRGGVLSDYLIPIEYSGNSTFVINNHRVFFVDERGYVWKLATRSFTWEEAPRNFIVKPTKH